MIHNIVQVKSIKPIKGKKGTYSSVTWQDGDKEFTKNVFEPAHQKIFKQALESGESVDVAMEKENDYWNVKSAEITSADVGQTTQQEAAKQSKSYTADPHKIESMEYSNARNLAVEMYCHVTDQGTPPDYELLDTIFRHINALGKDLVTVAKEQYGAVEK